MTLSAMPPLPRTPELEPGPSPAPAPPRARDRGRSPRPARLLRRRDPRPALGRSQRLATRTQCRALRLRDTLCSFPGHQAQHSDAHHIIPWSEGGPTDIEGLALLCRRHHVMVHEGGLRLVLDSSRDAAHHRRFRVLDPAGRPVEARWPAILETITRLPGPGPSRDHMDDPARIAAPTGGAGLRLADCVDELCRSVVELAA